MLNLPPTVKIYLAREPADLRKSLDGLAALVQQALRADLFTGHLFVFRGRRGDRLKMLYWDTDGLALWYKRLERGTFRFPAMAADAVRLEVRASELAMILDGIDVAKVHRQRRYHRPAPGPTSE
jgi:transposase